MMDLYILAARLSCTHCTGNTFTGVLLSLVVFQVYLHVQLSILAISQTFKENEHLHILSHSCFHD